MGWGGILLLAVIGVGFGVVSVVLSRLLGPRNPTPEKLAAYECGMPPVGDARERQSVKFYMICMIFLLFDIEIAFLGPWVLALRSPDLRWTGFFQIVAFFLILSVGYIYIWRKGVLDWGPDYDPDYKHAPKPGPAVVKRYRYGTRN
jgi:NADH-quinone oxidoreductase subunit A